MQNLRILLILLVLLSCSNEEEKRDISSVSRGENNEDLSLLSEDFQEKFILHYLICMLLWAMDWRTAF